MDINVKQVEELNILMVEDKVAYHEVYRGTICQEFPNVKMQIAENAASAKEIVNSLTNDLDLIILDYRLPDGTGEDLLQFFRGMEQFNNTPIVFLTGETDASLQGRLLARGANDFIEKGASPDVLLARIGIQLRQKLLFDELTEKALSMEMFTAGVLHDIRNIETNVIAHCGLLERKLAKEPNLLQRDVLMEELAGLKAQTYRINDYANAILKKVRLTQKTIDPTPVDLEEILEWVRHVLGGDGDFHLHQDTPLAPIRADKAMMKLIMLNICQNAQKYIKPGVNECHVHVSQDLPLKEEGYIVTTIEDSGIGVPEDELQSIFLPFHRATNNDTREGMGLGLSMVARVIQKMNGKIWAENGKNGLRMLIQLPVAAQKK